MVRHPARPDRVCKAFELAKIFEVERVGAADRQRNAVHDDRVTLGDLFKDVARSALRIHEVFGNHLEPIDRRMVFQDIREVYRSQAKAQTQVVVSEARRHGHSRTIEEAIVRAYLRTAVVVQASRLPGSSGVGPETPGRTVCRSPGMHGSYGRTTTASPRLPLLFLVGGPALLLVLFHFLFEALAGL